MLCIGCCEGIGCSAGPTSHNPGAIDVDRGAVAQRAPALPCTSMHSSFSKHCCGVSCIGWRVVLALAVPGESFRSVLVVIVWALRTITCRSRECKRMPAQEQVEASALAGQSGAAVQVVVISLMLGSLWFDLDVTPDNARSFNAVCLARALLLQW